MARIGNTSISSLLAGASAARAKQTAVNDAFHEYDYSTSEQTQADFNNYASYLKTRAAQSTDPVKTLAIQKKLDSANSGFISNEIQRTSDAVLTGEATLSDKFNKVASLYQQARASGNANLAQNLYSQLLSLDKQIQTQAETDSTKAYNKSTGDAAHKISNTIADSKNLEKMYNTALESGNMSPTEYHDKIAQLYHSRDAIYEAATSGQYGELTQDKLDSLQQDHFNMQNDDKYKTALAKESQNYNGAGTSYLKYDNNKAAFGESTSGMKSMQVIGKDGKATGQVVSGYDNFGAKDSKQSRISSATDNKTYVFDQKVGGQLAHVGYDRNYDPTTGQTYVVDQRNTVLPNGKNTKGMVHYISNDPNATLQRSLEPLTAADANAGKPTNLLDNTKQFYGDLFSGHGDGIDRGQISDLANSHKFQGLLAAGIPGVGPLLPLGINMLQHAITPKTLRAPNAQVSTAQVMSPSAVAATTPSVAVRPIAPTPSVTVKSPAQVAASTPSVTVKPIGPTPTVTVAGPKPAPAPAKTKPWWHFW